MREGSAGSHRNSTLGREEALWAEIIRCEVDSWRPSRLPGRFQPRTSRTDGPFWGSLPLVVAVCVIVLTVTTVAGLSTGVGGVLHNLAGIRPLTVPGAAGTGAPSGDGGRGVATGSSSMANSPHTSTATNGPSPRITRVGTASEPRATTPSPSAGAPASLPSLLPLPSPSPSNPPLILPLSTPSLSSEPPSGLSAGQPSGMGSQPVPSPGS